LLPDVGNALTGFFTLGRQGSDRIGCCSDPHYPVNILPRPLEVFL
jgi:hypothetical protein